MKQRKMLISHRCQSLSKPQVELRLTTIQQIPCVYKLILTKNVADFRDADKVQTITAPQWDIFSIFKVTENRYLPKSSMS